MKNSKFLTMAALVAAVIMTSCIRSEESKENTPVEIRLSSALSVQSRGDYSDADEQIPSGQTVTVYVDDAGEEEQLYGSELTADGSGNLSGASMYFPQNGNNVSIYAFHTNAALDGDYPTESLTHTVSADQSTADYPSDLLYAKSEGVAKQAGAVELTFHHLLSKVQVAVKAGDGAPDLEGATITIESTKPAASFTPNKTDDIEDIVITADGSVESITVAEDLQADDISTDATTKYLEAIIVPQTLTAGTSFIKVTLASGGELVYKIPSDITFSSGKKYIYNITVKLTGLTVNSTIANWEPGTTANGDAVMPLP